MTTGHRSNSKGASRLYQSAKISDYRFRKVLTHFARDSSATDTARATGLSVNSVHAIFRKLRVFFFECGVFLDFYAGQDPETFDSGNPLFEVSLLEFHFRRIGQKRGLKSPSAEPPYHFAESYWRYDFQVMMDERPSEAVYAMMLANLIEVIRLCGPIGSRPRNREAGLLAAARQIDQRISWFKRNAPGFADTRTREALELVRAIGPTD